MDVRNTVRAIEGAVGQGWIKAAGYLKQWLDEGHTVAELRAHSSLGPSAWKKLCDLVDGKVIPEVTSVRACVYEKIRLLAKEEQTALVNNGIDVVIPLGGEHFTAQRRAIGQLSVAEANQLFGFGQVRTPEEQKTYIRKKTMPKGTHVLPGRGKVIIHSIDEARLPYEIRANDVLLWISATEAVSVSHKLFKAIYGQLLV